MNAIKTLKTAIRANDPILLGRAVDSLRLAGFTYRECYRMALTEMPDLTEGDWEDRMAEADEAESK